MDIEKLIDAEYSLLSGRNRDEQLEKLSDKISNEILKGEGDKIYYSTAPIWDYEDNKWLPYTVGRFRNESKNKWESQVEKEDIIEGSSYEKYFNFFDNARKDFSFIEFFTNDISNLCPLFTIKYV